MDRSIRLRVNGRICHVEVGDGMTVLDALERIRVHQDPDLVYRHSCHHGSCGTCGMVIDDEPRLLCLTALADLEGEGGNAQEVRVEPLPEGAGPELLASFPGRTTYLRASETNRDAVPPAEVERWLRFEDCIECGLCVAACPVSENFLGPATLAAVHRERENNPARERELLELVDSDRGVWGCERALRCSAVCPAGVYPAKHIAVLQRKIRNRTG